VTKARAERCIDGSDKLVRGGEAKGSRPLTEPEWRCVMLTWGVTGWVCKCSAERLGRHPCNCCPSWTREDARCAHRLRCLPRSRTRMLPESSRAPRTCAQGPAHRNIKHGAAEPVGFLDGHRPADRHRRRAGGCAASRGGGSAAAVRQRAAGEQDVLDGGGGQLPAVRGAAAETDAALQQRWPRPVGEDEGHDVRRQRWDPASSQLCAPRGASVQARRVVRARQEPQAATPGRERGGDGRRAGCLAQGLVSLCCDVEAGQRQADRLGTCRCRCGYTRGRRGARERIETAAGTVAATAGRRRRQAADHT
jgi:hypothetical protein